MIEDEKIVGCGCCGWWLLCVTHELSTTTEGSVRPHSAGATANVDWEWVSDGGCCCCCCCCCCYNRTHRMASPTLSDLKKALQSWKAETEVKRVDIVDRLAHGRPVSGEEEAWLDEGGNFVDEDVVLEKLQSASDISSALKDLSTSQRTCV